MSAPDDPPQATPAPAVPPGWVLEANALAKTFVFPNFRDALAFMVRAGLEAEAMDHHPDWTNVYNRVAIRLSTHSAGGKVTDLDERLAVRIEAVAARFQPRPASG